MSILTGDTGRSSVGPLRTFTMTNMTPVVDNYFGASSPTILGTSEPATPIFSYTVQASDLLFNTITPAPYDFLMAPIVYVAGKTVTACTLYYKVLYNGSSISNGTNSGVGANVNWTYSICNSSLFLAPVKAGDVIDVKVWSNMTDTQYDYNGVFFQPCRLVLSKPGTVLKDVSYNYTPTVSHTLTHGRSPASINQQTSALSVAAGVSANVSNSMTVPFISQISGGVTASANFGVLSPYFGDIGLRTNANFNGHSTYHPYYQRNIYPSTISYREVTL